MRARWATVVSALVAVLIFSGCGGGDSGGSDSAADTGQAEAVAAALKSSVAQGNYAKACDLYTSAAKTELARRAKGAARDCPAVLAQLFRSVPASAKKKLREIRITSTTVTGSHATAADSAGGTTYLTKQGDKWLVDKTPSKSG